MKTSSPTAIKPATPLKILLQGPPGSRKTTFALQFPDVHAFDCDRNLDGPRKVIMDGIKDASGKVIVPAVNPNLNFTYDEIRYDDSGASLDIEECYNRLCDKTKLFKTDPLYKARKTILVDSLSHVNEFIIRHTLKLQGKKNKSYEMEARDWNPFKSFAYIFLVARLEEANKTVICTCHEVKIYEKPDKDNMMNPEVREYEPFFQGKLGEMLGAFFTDIWRLEVRPAPGGKTELWLQTQKTAKANLKNSVGMPAEVNVTDGFKAVEPYLKGRV